VRPAKNRSNGTPEPRPAVTANVLRAATVVTGLVALIASTVALLALDLDQALRNYVTEDRSYVPAAWVEQP
jgi:hypothetical protein